MAIVGVSQSLNLSGSENLNIYFNHPANAGMSEGYWFYYSASAANNTLGAKIKPYRWATPLNTNETGDVFTIQGTIVLVSESLNRQRIFHGSSIVRNGVGTNIQTGILEDDSFFFYHLGDLNAADDIGYWDYASIQNGGTEWDYFQYHQHNPNVYKDFNNGRQTQGSQYYINEADKRYANIQPVGVSVMGTPYTSVLARIHQPSIGGAHNSHYDVEMPATANKNYMMGGVIAGTSNRFHIFYTSTGSADVNVYGRTYVLSTNAFTAEVDYGAYPLAASTYSTTTTTGRMEQFPFRASAGVLFGTTCYIPVIYSGSNSTFDLKVWSFESANTVLQSAVTITNLVTGSTQRPDVHFAKTSTKLTVLVSDVNNGGVDFYILSGSTWVNEGSVVTNGTGDVIRIHGFNYNSADSKFYGLLTGAITGSGNYSGSGVYSFSDGAVFDGYEHLSYITGSYGFKLQEANTNGYLRYQNADGALYYYSGSEPQGIADTERILIFDKTSPQFYNKIDTNQFGSEQYFHGIRLDDGRLIGVGNIEDNFRNRGGYDLIMAVYSDTGTNPEFIATGGSGDDYFTAIIEDRAKQNLWMTGYTKSYLAQKRDIRVHGFGRGILSGSNKYEWKDFVLDTSGNQYYVGNALNYSGSLVAKYTYNLDLSWVAYLESTGSNTLEAANGVTIDSSNNIYVVGTTNSTGNGGSDAYVAKLNSSGQLLWNKYYGSAGNETGSAIATITSGSTDYIVTSVASGSASVIMVLDTNGTIVEQNRISDFYVNRIRKSDSEANPYFLLAGRTTTLPYSAKIAKGEVSGSTMFKWVNTYVSGTFSTEAYDIRNTDEAGTSGGLGSQTGPRYVIVGNEANDGFVVKIVVDEDGGNYQSTKVWGKNLVSSSLTSLTNTPYDETPESGKQLYVVGHSSGSLEGEGGWEGIVMGMSASGDRLWTNTLGHTGDEKLYAVEWDVTGDNIISAGWSESHTNGRRTFSFRSWKDGLGTGNYHEKDAPGMEIWYQSSSLGIKTNNGSLSNVTAPVNLNGGISVLTGSLSASYQTFFTEEYYDGGNLWDMFIAKVNLDDYQEYRNTEAHKFHDEFFKGFTEYVDSIFTFYQVGTAGDGAADDGSYFGYDILEMSGSNHIFVAGQTSGNIGKTNTGASGVYDYINAIFDPDTEEFEFYQVGTELDEEVYAATLLNDGSGSVAFVGRTAGTLGGVPDPFGSYDIFLGIYNPITEQTQYFQTGSGFMDRGVNVHDIGNNQLAIVYETADAIFDNTSQGGMDIGVITLNYSSSQWLNAYQVGTAEDERLDQDGKPSYYLKESNRIAIIGTTFGTFSDDGTRFGQNDILLAILNLSDGTWRRYQIGTPANDFGTTVFGVGGDRLIVGGYSDASFGAPNNGIFCAFDATEGVKGKSS